MKKNSVDFLQKLLNTPSPSSGEAAGQRLWVDYVTPFADQVETDAYGNAIAILNPKGSPKIMICGHADEIGFQVQYIDDNGFVYFAAVGGPDIALARGQRVHIHTKKGKVLGAIGALAVHMQNRNEAAKVPACHDLFIDIGAKDKASAQKRVSVGDLITYTVGCERLNEDLIVARACDNRIGTFTAAEVLRILSEKKKKPSACIVAASSIQEENGLYGAKMLGYSVNPDAAIVIDVGHATDIPIADKKRFGDVKLGKGAVLSLGSVNHRPLVERLEKVALKNKIKFQRGIDPRGSGTDADGIFIQRGGIPCAAVGVPNRYMHTPVEMVSLDDLENLSQWLAAFSRDLRSNEKFKVKV